MIKIFIYEVRSCFYRMSIIKKMCFLIYLIIFGFLINTWEGNMMDQALICLWVPGVVFSDFRKACDMHRLLPMSDMQFKLWLVCKAPLDGLIISFMTAFATIPYVIKEGTLGVFFRILIAVSFVSIWSNGCSFKYKKISKPGILYRVSEFIVFITMCIVLLSEVEPYSFIVDIIEFAASLLVIGVFLGIKFFLIKDIPVSEMSFETASEKG